MTDTLANKSILSNIISTAAATFVAEIGTLPIAAVKTNYQNSNNIPMRTIVRDIWSERGIKGFYGSSGWAVSSSMISMAFRG